jgi:NAD(P)-dependent dehydrogenase (short-subunit alcohol dehydrogenase family)
MGHGHRIVLADLDRTRLDDAVRELTVAEVDAIGVVCDITDKASAVLAFCASEAPGYLTGVDILVDGGTKAGKEFATARKSS